MAVPPAPKASNGSSGGKSRKPIALSVAVPTEDLSYHVLVGRGLLGRVGAEIARTTSKAKRVAVVSDETVMGLYGQRVCEAIGAAGFDVARIEVPPGEASKNPVKLIEVVESLISAGLGRRDVVVALGGGVVGDLAGLAAALFMRGVSLWQVPTSLLSQVDASVGGKVAVDLPSGKNLLGAFHFPVGVIIDPEVLQTLPDRELGCGLAEMLKHGALFSADHFHQIVDASAAIYAHDADILTKLVATSVAHKANCVSRDPLETGEAGKGRVVLNLGHTVGHALELVSGLELRHGEAVALGLRAAARVSDRMKLVAQGEGSLEEQVTSALQTLRLPTDLDAWLGDDRVAALERALGNDKKRDQGSMSYIALSRIGEPAVVPLTAAEIMALLRA